MAATSQLPDAREGMQAFLDKRKPRWRQDTTASELLGAPPPEDEVRE
jgi:hypothetical protein